MYERAAHDEWAASTVSLRPRASWRKRRVACEPQPPKTSWMMGKGEAALECGAVVIGVDRGHPPSLLGAIHAEWIR